MTPQLGIGIIGSGFAASLHARGYQRLAHLGVKVVAIASRHRAHAAALAEQYDIPACHDDATGVINDSHVDVVDLAVPNALHYSLAIDSARAAKHVICEKPLTGYFGEASTPRVQMLAEAMRHADEMIHMAREHGVRIMYAENLIYAPAIRKIERLIEVSGGALLDIRGEESHSGSHAAYARVWQESGGGSLLRLGAHPIGAALYLKRQEGLARTGRPIVPVSVMAEVATLTRVPSFPVDAHPWLNKGWQDVEDWASSIVTFSDGTRGTFLATDTLLGGMRDRLEFSLSNARIICDLTHNGSIQAYAPNEEAFAGEYLAEKLETKAGWSYPAADKEWALGYPQELADFAGAVLEDRAPLSDAELGRDVLRVIYGGYVSAEEGRRVTLATR